MRRVLLLGGGVGLVGYGVWRQKETSKPFNTYTTAEQAINNKDLTGRLAIVTGCNTGIGKETARVLTKQGCNVIMACRTQSKAEKARQDILNDLQLPQDYDKLTFMKLDLSSLQSVSEFANQFNEKDEKIDYLINNAGVMAFPDYRTSADGFEMQFATNHLGHFYLTKLLMSSLSKGSNSDEKPRVINVASVGERIFSHYNNMDRLLDACIKENAFLPESWKSKYDPWDNYSISKTSNILFGKQLGKLYNDSITSVSLHPGAIGTDLSRSVTAKDGLSFLFTAIKIGLLTPMSFFNDIKSIPQGAATTVRCVSLNENEIIQGGYYFNCQDGTKTLRGPVIKDKDGKLAEKLWQLSEQLIESRRG